MRNCKVEKKKIGAVRVKLTLENDEELKYFYELINQAENIMVRAMYTKLEIDTNKINTAPVFRALDKLMSELG